MAKAPDEKNAPLNAADKAAPAIETKGNQVTIDPTQMLFQLSREFSALSQRMLDLELSEALIDEKILKGITPLLARLTAIESPLPRAPARAPSICRLVLFTFQRKQVPAIISRLYAQGQDQTTISTTVELYVLWPQEFSALSPQRTSVPFSPDFAEECWSWPKIQ